MNDNMGRLLYQRIRDALFIFGVCGLSGILVDLDHVWNVLGMEEPFTLTGFPGRCLHTTLVFILYAVIAGSIINAYAHRQNYFRRSVDISRKRVSGGISSVCWDNYSFNCDECVHKYMCTQNVKMSWP